MRTPIRYYRHRRQRKLLRLTDGARRFLQATLAHPTRNGAITTSFLDREEVDDRLDLRHSSGFGKTARLSVYQSFTGLLMNYMRKRKRSAVVLCRGCKIPREALAEILSDQNYQPTRSQVQVLVLALHLRMWEAEHLMAAAGYAFSHEDPQDIVFEYCLRIRMYRLERVNDLLNRLGIPPIPQAFPETDPKGGLTDG